ncbi:phosphonate ABC transporter substrate-binding protein [Pseudoclavibacter endophyticus]|uniref:Phosphate/phosphite/phosphonate ABC transporter substrate-binding protein n=1 Tax=Pseudoclavibacter endophyticus TaxID=1778590 RepID=A0A6H9WC95_9MICO|nr:phosphate/phosphite/phosphonate ABC transporter substrate-binding protein [Pseudoclavibacter endophyticus]KAB1648290.1 phosphate/phosphite/phosphonate ABC transporter substrate-binding protein [Pseudoclavibacter endophyticus]GGA71377.1 phosphonate ABC transporter substrate-binding protein [Pseudoclavibacter endophyticus]
MPRLAKLLAPLMVAVLALTGCGAATAEPPSDTLVVQFVPTRADSDMEALAQPLAGLLSEQLDREVVVTIATDYSTIVEALAAQQIDVGIMPPATYVLAADQGTADAVLTAQIPGTDPVTAENTDELVAGFRGEIVVAADSGITSLDDLRGATIAVQNAASASGYIFPVVEMAEAGLDLQNDVTLTTVSGIDSALLAVLNGDADAAFGFEGSRRLLKGEFPDITELLSVAYLTEAVIPNDAIAVSTTLDDADRQAVKAAFLAIADDPEGLEIISTLYSHQGYVDPRPADYDIVRDYTQRAGEL